MVSALEKKATDAPALAEAQAQEGSGITKHAPGPLLHFHVRYPLQAASAHAVMLVSNLRRHIIAEILRKPKDGLV